MIRKLNVFLSDNNYLDAFFPSKEKNSNALTVESVMNLKFINPETRMLFSFFGVENHKVWREVFVPLAQQLKAKSTYFDVSVNTFNFKPSSFQIFFCKENNIHLYFNVNDLSVLKDAVETIPYDDLKTIFFNYYIGDNNISDVHKIIEYYTNSNGLNVSFKATKSLSAENRKVVIKELEAQKDRLLNKESKLTVLNYAYYAALDILSMESTDFSKLKDNNNELYLSNNMMVYKASSFSDACAETLWLGKIEKDDVLYRHMTRFGKEELDKICDENDILSFITVNNPARDKEDLTAMSRLSDELYSMLKFSKDDELVTLYEKMKFQTRAFVGSLRASITSLPYDDII